MLAVSIQVYVSVLLSRQTNTVTVESITSIRETAKLRPSIPLA